MCDGLQHARQCGIMISRSVGRAGLTPLAHACMCCRAAGVDLSRFDAASLIAFTATKETYYETETDGRIPPRCGTYRADQWAYHCPAVDTQYRREGRKQVADDLGVGMSTLNKWITAHRDTDVVSKEDLGLAQENDRLRRENRILKEEREILKKAKVFFASQKP